MSGGTAQAETFTLSRGVRNRKEVEGTEAEEFFQAGEAVVSGLWTREQGGKGAMLGLQRQKGLWGSG